jgi:hypothetical protein
MKATQRGISGYAGVFSIDSPSVVRRCLPGGSASPLIHGTYQ